MKIKRFEFNMFPVNCYVLWDETNEAVVIDLPEVLYIIARQKTACFQEMYCFREASAGQT